MAKVTKRRNKWALDYRTPDGKRRFVEMPKDATKGMAQKKLNEILDEMERGTYLDPKKKPTVSTVAEDYLKNRKRRVRERTYNQYARHFRLYIKPKFGGMQIHALTTLAVEKWVNQLCDKGMTPVYVKKVMATLGRICKYAMIHQHLDRSPVDLVETPSDKGTLEAVNQGDTGKGEKHNYLTPEQVRSLIEATADTQYQMLFMLAVSSGARQGELFGLKWSDVDFDGNQISIRRNYGRAGRWSKPKTKAAVRSIDIGPNVMTALKRWKVQCPPNELDLVFPNGNGNPIDHGFMTRIHWKPALVAAGLPDIRFHDLRHTYASIQLTVLKHNLIYVSKQMGHSKPSVTMDTYTHLIANSDPHAAEKYDSVLFGYILDTSENDEAGKVAVNV